MTSEATSERTEGAIRKDEERRAAPAPKVKHFTVEERTLVDVMPPNAMDFYAGLWGCALAKAHSRSGDAVALASYLGTNDSFDRAMADFAEISRRRTPTRTSATSPRCGRRSNRAGWRPRWGSRRARTASIARAQYARQKTFQSYRSASGIRSTLVTKQVPYLVSTGSPSPGGAGSSRSSKSCQPLPSIMTMRRSMERHYGRQYPGLSATA